MQERFIYLDYHASTPVDERVLQAMLPYFTEHFGNPLSQHQAGWKSGAALEHSRNMIAEVLGCTGREIIFTSGATESCNLAIKGVAQANSHKGKHIITSAIEHKAVLDSCHELQRNGFELTVLGVDANGKIDLEELTSAITDKTILVSIMSANNEVGTIQDIASIGTICRERNVLFHTDATQFICYEDFKPLEMNVDLASFTAHKFYGPKGVGALFVRHTMPQIRLREQLSGGGQESGIRSGTHNTPGIVGMAKALKIVQEERESERARIYALRNELMDSLNDIAQRNKLQGTVIGINPKDFPNTRLCNNLLFSFEGIESDVLHTSLKSVGLSSSSTCSFGSFEGSHVLKAMNIPKSVWQGAIRFGLGRYTTTDDITESCARISKVVESVVA
jgi:cysteine desulfurase